MSKRVAGYQLTAENFDQEDDKDNDVEAVGAFSKASEDVISKRIIKKARRRGEDTEVSSASPFKGFAGFGSSPSIFGKSNSTSSTLSSKPANSITPFVPSFGSPSFTNAKSTEANPFMINTKPTTAPANPFKIKNTTTQDKKMIDEEFKDTNSSETNGATSEADVYSKSKEKSFGLLKHSPMKNSSPNEEVSNQYVEQITELNLSVFGWIKQHIDKDPLIDLTPVFSDYSKYMREIDEKYGKKKQWGSGEKSGNYDSSKADNDFVSKVTDGVKDNEVKSESASATPVLEKKEETKPIGFSSKIPLAGFFSAAQTSTPMTSSAESKSDDKTKPENDDDDGEAPKVERKTIVESDAFYTTRCKLFFKKGQEWKELGVGMLYLKPLNKKTQLLVRMETSGGNVILNICLHSSLPSSRVGKNNVSIATVPNPPVFVKPADGDNTKPVTYLIRVKGAAEADELMKIIDDKKSED